MPKKKKKQKELKSPMLMLRNKTFEFWTVRVIPEDAQYVCGADSPWITVRCKSGYYKKVMSHIPLTVKLKEITDRYFKTLHR